MARYQIRGFDNLTLEDVIEEMAGKGWDDVKDFMDLQHMHAPLKDYRRFQNAVYRAVMPFIRSYRLCGNFPICTEPVRKGENNSDEIYHLFLNGTRILQDFLGGSRAKRWNPWIIYGNPSERSRHMTVCVPFFRKC